MPFSKPIDSTQKVLMNKMSRAKRMYVQPLQYNNRYARRLNTVTFLLNV